MTNESKWPRGLGPMNPNGFATQAQWAQWAQDLDPPQSAPVTMESPMLPKRA